MTVEFLPEMKVCCTCKQKKPKEAFYLCSYSPSGLQSKCIKCEIIIGRNNKLQRYYGITEVQYDLILESQNNICALCGKPEVRKSNDKIVDRFAVNHNHKTFKIRGLLCFQCNTILGKIEKLPGGIHSIIKYLKKGG